VRIGVLGPLEVDAQSARLGSRDRIVLAALAMRPGELLTAEQLADAVWGEEPPASWAKNLQGCVSRLRKLLGADAIETSARGYRLRVPLDTVDASEFSQLAGRADELMILREYEHARYVASQGLALWRGQPLAELEQWGAGAAETARLCELHAELEELALEASLASGHHRDVLTQAAAMVEAAPLRERRWALLARAQYQAGHQAEALRTLRRIRTILQRELGLDPGPELVALEQSILRQDSDLFVDPAGEPPDQGSPYLGLTPYGENDCEAFFGRETEIEKCLARLREVTLLAVVGASGSGKSSLLRAGLVPALRRDGADVRLISPGRHPMDAFEAARARSGSFVLIDQAEEAFSLCDDDHERSLFFAALVDHTQQGHVVLALRADHTGDLAKQEGLAPLVERGLFLLGAMSPDSLRAAIEGPARQHGLVLEPGLTDLLIREVEGEPGALPMLSHALRETWLRHEGRTLTVAGYQASGGIRGAVAQSAERLYGGIGEAEQVQLRDLVLRLVVPGPEGEPVRGRVPRHQAVAAPAQEHLVDAMVAARLVTSDDGVIALAHEALVRAWPRLRGWLEDDLTGQRMRHRLTQATEDWVALGCQDGDLYRGARLAAVREWVETTRPQLTEDEQRFLDASLELAASEEQSAVELARTRGRTVRRLRFPLAGATVLLVLALVAGFVAEGQTRKADRSTLSADAGRVGAQALVTTDISDALLRAVAGARLDPSRETERDLDAVVAQHPDLVGSITVPTGANASSVAVSPDGGQLAVADTAHHVWTYDAHTLTPITDAQVGAATPTSAGMPLAYSPAGGVLAVGAPPSRDDLVRLLDPHTLKPIPGRLVGWPPLWGQLVSLGYSANGKYLAAGDLSQGGGPFVAAPSTTSSAALVWDMSKPGLPLVRRIELPGTSVVRAVPSSDGKTLYVTNGDGGPMTAYDLTTGKPRFEVKHGTGDLLALDPTGHLVAVTGSKSRIVIADTRTGRTFHLLHAPAGDVEEMAFSHDGSTLAATSTDEKITIWDDSTGSVAQTLSDGAHSANGVAFSPDGSTLYTTADEAHQVHLWDLTGRRGYLATVPIQHPLNVVYGPIKPSPRGDVLATMGVNSTNVVQGVWFTDLSTGTRLPRMRPTGDEDSAGSWSPDGQRYAVGYFDGTVRVFQHGQTQPVVQRRVLKNVVYEVCYSPDGRGLAVVDTAGNVVMVEATTLRPIGRPVHLPNTSGAEVSVAPDNRTAFVTGSVVRHNWGFADPINRWWLIDLVRGRVLNQGQLDIAGTYTAFSPHGDRIAVGGMDGSVELLDATTGRPVTSPVVAHDGLVDSLTVNSTGTRIASASAASDLALWDGRTGELLSTARVPGQETSAYSGFRPDGTLTVATMRGQVYRWDPSLSRAITFACRAAGRDMTRAEWNQEIPDQPYRSVCPTPR
jgi:WD40 repeat protein/DNA-binding SARP family transcriptional activator